MTNEQNVCWRSEECHKYVIKGNRRKKTAAELQVQNEQAHEKPIYVTNKEQNNKIIEETITFNFQKMSAKKTVVRKESCFPSCQRKQIDKKNEQMFIANGRRSKRFVLIK